MGGAQQGAMCEGVTRENREGKATCSWRGTLLDLMLEMAGKLMLATEPRATAAMDRYLVPAKATQSCCTQLTAMPVHQDRTSSEGTTRRALLLGAMVTTHAPVTAAPFDFSEGLKISCGINM